MTTCCNFPHRFGKAIARGLGKDAVFDPPQRIENTLGPDVGIQQAEGCCARKRHIRRPKPVKRRLGVLEHLVGPTNNSGQSQKLGRLLAIQRALALAAGESALRNLQGIGEV